MRGDVERIKRMVEKDMSGGLADTLRVIRADCGALLTEFAEVNGVDVAAERTESGYRITVTADVSSIYAVGKLSSGE